MKISVQNKDKLAVLGGPRSVPENMEFKMWPPVDERDEKLVLEALRQDNHCQGPHVEQTSGSPHTFLIEMKSERVNGAGYEATSSLRLSG